MTFSLQFTSTRQDLLDAFRAARTAVTGMRRWARIVFAILGFLSLAAVGAAVATGKLAQERWRSALGLLVGSLIVWKFAVRPFLMKQRIRALPAAQPLSITFDDAGIDIDAQGGGRFQRAWSELLGVLAVEKGVMMTFSDGMIHWLPDRAFRSAAERAAFVEYAELRILKHRHAPV